MKKLFFTLIICLFSLGAFASNLNANEIKGTMEAINTFEKAELLVVGECQTTVIITIDHGTWEETYTVTFTYEC